MLYTDLNNTCLGISMETIKRRLWQIGSLLGILTSLLGLAVLAGWYMDLGLVTAIRADYIPMAPSTALLFVLSGLGVITRNLTLHQESPIRFEPSIPFFILTIAILLLTLSLQHIYSSWEYLGLSLKGFVAGSPIGHMSPVTALSFIAVAISLILCQKISTKKPQYAILGVIVTIAFLLLCLGFFLSYIFGSPLLYDGTFIPPAINTLVGFLLLAVALLETHLHSMQIHDNWLGKIAKNSSSFIWGFIGGTILIISVAYGYQRQHEVDFEAETSEQITAIAQLKSREIQLMRKVWQEDAQTLLHSEFVIQVAEQLNNKSTLKVQDQMLGILEGWKIHSSYDGAIFFDYSGHEVISTLPTEASVSSAITTAIKIPINHKQAVLHDFYRNEFDNQVYLAVIIPITMGNGAYGGTIVLRINPQTELYPLIKQWPVVSESAETLLVRQEGNEAVFLNELRFKKNTALILRHSIEEKTLPAVKAVEGFTGVVDGIDYRGIKVIADVRAIPDSPWFMIARIDRDEVFEALKERVWTSIVFVLTMIVALGVGLSFLWRQQRLSYYREQYETSLRLEIYGQAFSQNSEGVMVTDAKGNLTLINDAFTKITGYDLSDVLGKNPRLLSSGRQDALFYQTMWKELLEKSSWQGEIWNKDKKGKEYPAWLTITALHDENTHLVSHYIGVFSDISKRKKDAEEINYLAHYDALTSLPNRTLLDDRINQSIHFSKRSKHPFAVMFLDLDHFKHINDSLGHHIGDLMLIDVANRLMTVIRQEDTVSRLGGDEFVLLLQETGADGAALVAKKINDIISQPFILEGSELTISSSIGIAMYPIDGEDLSSLLKSADSAMYEAKDSGRDRFQFFTKALSKTANRRLEIDNALRGAINRDELELYYQPQLDINSGKLVGCEALLRWKHPKLGQVSPGEFIPIAEASGLILSIDNWVLHQATRQMAVWSTRGILDFTVAVNLSANQFHHQDLVPMVLEALSEHKLSASNLELELTEGLMIKDVESTVKIIELLHNAGIKLCIDDFGTGYSSLSYLKRFKIDKLKIDQSFVTDLTTDPDDAAIVNTIIALANSLGLNTIAEGVETQEQQEFLRNAGCNEVQGYLNSRPLPVAEFEAFIASLNS